ncbi:hypothetical protein [Streptomyces mirabilis]|uniref:hypothetical protein n=1 Tax=Streptomyces mirabilis TaxID=68239 RepID=UPI0033B404EA
MCAPLAQWRGLLPLIGGAGLYAVTPRGRCVPGGHYEEGSLIWRSRWVTEDGIVECREALAFPGEPGRLVLLRRVHATEGPARVRVILHPLTEYGTQQLREARRDNDGVWTARVGDLHLRWTGGGDASLSEVGSADAHFTLDLALDAGQRHDLYSNSARGRHGTTPLRFHPIPGREPNAPGRTPYPPWTTPSPPTTHDRRTPYSGA